MRARLLLLSCAALLGRAPALSQPDWSADPFQGFRRSLDWRPGQDFGPWRRTVNVFEDRRVPAEPNTDPWFMVGRLKFSDQGHCSGTLIGRRTILTACHCILNKDGTRAVPAFFELDSSGTNPAIARVSWIDPNGIRTLPGCLGHAERDWALLRLEKPMGAKYGFLRVSEKTPEEALKSRVASVGYPEDKPAKFVDPSCRLTKAEGGLYLTDCAILPGDSGGPILQRDERGEYEVVGVLSGMNTEENKTPLKGIPYSDDLANYATILHDHYAALQGYLRELDRP